VKRYVKMRIEWLKRMLRRAKRKAVKV
jgi:hypothetical protein